MLPIARDTESEPKSGKSLREGKYKVEKVRHTRTIVAARSESTLGSTGPTVLHLRKLPRKAGEP
jgi:hypothetical protein